MKDNVDVLNVLDQESNSLSRKLLRPPGLGFSSASTGQSPLARRLHLLMYGSDNVKDVWKKWAQSLESVEHPNCFILGVPADTGSGSVRGAAYGPIGVREALYSKGAIDGVDAGDVFSVPHLLHDDMLNQKTLNSIRNAVYGTEINLPVSPLSIAEYVSHSLMKHYDAPSLFTIGGDHSTSGAILPQLITAHSEPIALIVIDGHTDLEESRYGLPLTYSSWIKYADSRARLPAVVLIGSPSVPDVVERSNRLLLVGLSETKAVKNMLHKVESWLDERNIKSIYLSIDIDATSPDSAPATGLPAADGVSVKNIITIISALKARYKVRGGDVTEVAPPLGTVDVWAQQKTCQTAALYLRAMIEG